MDKLTNLGRRDRFLKLLVEVPLPVRLALAGWILLSLGFNFGLPSSTATLSPMARFIVLLPMAVISLGLSVFSLWNGCKTLYRAFRSVFGSAPDREVHRRRTYSFIGGVGAVNIYLVIYSLIVFAGAAALHRNAVGVVISVLLSAALGFALFRRGPHPRDVKIFLWGSLAVTALFGLIMFTVERPPT